MRVHFMETSAKDGWNVAEAFRDLVRQVLLGVHFDRNSAMRNSRYSYYLQREILKLRDMVESLPKPVDPEVEGNIRENMFELMTWVGPRPFSLFPLPPRLSLSCSHASFLVGFSNATCTSLLIISPS